MTKGLIGKKIGMTQVFSENGNMIPVTVLRVGPCNVSQIKENARDGYSSVQLSFGDVKPASLSKAEVAHLAKNNISAKRFLKEFQFDGDSPALGSEIKAGEVFKISDKVKVTGVSKGKGFQGVIKRYGHRGGPMAHGSRHHRAPGSIGACATPSRVFKGVKMPGRHGSAKTSITNLKIVRILENENLVYVSGSIPGSDESLVTIEKF
ncbi:MAG: 50S ribosomal protein L3 [Leptospira sp.]|nr:50S ribosomal protein L3 [Leptospira sp.]